jgi:hypothetical protein
MNNMSNINIKDPVPRKGVYELYWKFAYERQRVFNARAAGKPGPWTDDPIIQNYKFCNVFRAADRVSQYMIREVCYSETKDTVADRLFQIIAFRMFSNIDTWEAVKEILGHSPTIDDLVSDAFEQALNTVKDKNGKLYTGAFVLCATDAYGRRIKHLNHTELFKDMFINSRIDTSILEASSLEEIYILLHTFPLMGDFMSYQIAIDLNYSKYVNFSENDFTKAGPGALRGISKVFEDTNGLSPEEIILWMTKHQDREFKKLGYDFKGLNGRPIQAIDAQNLFCETDKYCRVAAPHLKSNRTKIKAVYKESSGNIEYFFPPKWNINASV